MVLLSIIKGLMFYLALEDCIYCNVNAILWIILNILVIIWNPWFILIFPVYFMPIKGIGMADWIFSINLFLCKDLYLFTIIFSIFSISLMIKKKSPILFPLFLAGLIT